MMRLLNWNVAWASPSSPKGRQIQSILRELDPDVIILTETHQDLLPSHGHRLFSTTGHGYNHPAERRKVALWSKTPWTEADDSGHPDLPGGRYITGTTRGIRFIGVCIPWKDAHVSTGRRDRAIWQDHLTYLEALGKILRQFPADSPLCIAGDFNQRLPIARQPAHVHAALIETLSDYQIPTTGMTDPSGDQLIDHFAVSPSLTLTIDRLIPKTSGDLILTDHTGIFSTLSKKSAQSIPPT